MTKVAVHRHVSCPFSATMEFAEKAIARRNGLYLTPSPPLGERVRFAATSASDTTDLVRKHDALLIAWRPQTHGLFPDFRGALTVRPQHRGSSLRMEGHYDPPFGMAGKIFDFFVGRNIARRTMHHFLGELAVEIEAEYEQERHKTTCMIGENGVHVHPVSN